MDGPESQAGSATANGTTLTYEVAGAGPALVLIHAGIADSRMWDGLFARWAASHRVLRYDLRGFGRSGRASGTFAHRDDLRALLDTLGIDRAAVLGISFGAGVALDFALAYPERVSALVLAAARPGGMQPPPDLTEVWEAEEEALARGDLDAANEVDLRAWVDGPHRTPDQVDPDVRARMREMNRLVLEREAAETDADPQPLDPPAVERLGEVRAPTLLVVGDLDRPGTLTGTERLAEGIPEARRVVIPGAAHMVPLEGPDRFAELVEEFLEQVGYLG
jgi:pimeloyl-ACP methyl ester carboxylesterase